MRKRLCALAAISCCCAGQVHAQVSGSLTLVSDYLYRGTSLSDGRPVPQLNLSYDSDDGWFLGGFASPVRADPGPQVRAQTIAYGGYARRLASGLSWEAGLAQHIYSGAATRNYRELHVGLSSEQISARLSYSPEYLGYKARSAYAELNGSHPLRDNVSAFVHLGYLAYLGGFPSFMARYRSDIRLGLASGYAGWKLQLAWDAGHVARPEGPQYGGSVHSRRGLVLSAARPF